jgi:hypothetical protein
VGVSADSPEQTYDMTRLLNRVHESGTFEESMRSIDITPSRTGTITAHETISEVGKIPYEPTFLVEASDSEESLPADEASITLEHSPSIPN